MPGLHDGLKMHFYVDSIKKTSEILEPIAWFDWNIGNPIKIQTPDIKKHKQPKKHSIQKNERFQNWEHLKLNSIISHKGDVCIQLVRFALKHIHLRTL